jgi:hypothetical protein
MNSRPSTSLSGRECVIWALALFALQALSFSGFFFNNEILTPFDLIDTMPPWRDHLPEGASRPVNKLMYDPIMAFRPDFLRFQDALREGRWPLWNDMEMCGLPLLANCQSRVFYPPNLLLLVTDVDTAMSLFVVIKLWLAAFVAYVCARLLGFGIWPSRWYSVIWGLGCFTRLWAYWPITDVLVWIPVVFLGAEWLAERRLRKGFFAVALGGVMCLFAGHPETAFAINAYMALYFVLRIVFAWKGGLAPMRPLALYAGAWLLSLAVYAVQLLPFAEYLANSAPVADRIQMPLTTSELTSFWVPRFFGTIAEKTFWDKNLHNSNLTIQQYAGIATWLGIAFAVAHMLRKSPLVGPRGRARLIALLLVSFASLAAAMDISTLEWVKNLPGFSHMRTIYHVYFSLFAIPVVGLIGLEAWFAQRRRLREMSAALIVIVPAAAIVGVVYVFNGPIIQMAGVGDYVLRAMLTTVGFTVITVLVVAAHCFTKRTRLVWALLVLVGLCDVYWPARGFNSSVPRQSSFRWTPLIAYIQDKSKPCRVDPFGAAIAPGTLGNFGLEEWDGYDGLFPGRPIRFRKAFADRIWDRIFAINGVDYYLNDPRYEELVPIRKLVDRGELELETTLDHLEVYRHVGMLPRARLVGKLETATDADALFDRMRESEFDPGRAAITELPPPGSAPNSDETSVGTAAIGDHKPDRVVVKCDASTDAVLVLAETFYPGWTATVDGAPAAIYPVYYCFRGVTVPKGRHVVEFRYQPRSLTLGLLISASALTASAALAIWLRPRRGLTRIVSARAQG